MGNWPSSSSAPQHAPSEISEIWKKYQGQRLDTLPESLYDDLPIDDSTDIQEGITRIALGDLLSLLDPTSDAERKVEISALVVDALRRSGYFVIGFPDDEEKKLEGLYCAMSKFFTLEEEEKHKPGRAMQEFQFKGRRLGYDRLFFDNLDNKRDPEERDVFEVNAAALDKIGWPSDSFKDSVMDVHSILHTAMVGVLKGIAEHLGCPPSDFFQLISKELKDGLPDPAQETNSNFCLFRYNDDKRVYTQMQKCMVHQDSGLITLLPRSTHEGLHILDKQKNTWIPIEHFTSKRDVMVYTGLAMQVITRGYILAAVHRVVRSPGVERYSMPLEIKPRDSARLEPVTSSLIPTSMELCKTYLDQVPVHSAICNECGHWIVQVRYKCVECEDYDLCCACKAKNDSTRFHEDRHHFNVITNSTLFMEGMDSKLIAWELQQSIAHRRSIHKWWRAKLSSSGNTH